MLNRLQPVRFYVGLFAFLLAALVVATFYFLFGMATNSYIVSDGAQLATYYLDAPRYDNNLQGFIYALSFMVASALMLLLILLPDERLAMPAQAASAPPQPRRRSPSETPSADIEQTAPLRQEQPTAAPTAAQTSPLTIERGEGEDEAAPPEAPAESDASGEEEVTRSADRDLPEVASSEHRYEDTGDDDIVYGTGRISEDSTWEFIQEYPDSAVKFLYRKTLDNKPLAPTEEDIYRGWELRGLTRAMVREIVLQIMRWQTLPDDFPHNIWRELRDQIYEMRSK